jgi:hypothetical protein
MHDMSVCLPEASKGKWTISKFEIGENYPGKIHDELRGMKIAPGSYTRLLHEDRGVIMSDTPFERRGHLDFVYHARGQVLINGLGIGMALSAILKKTDANRVDKVTVVEIDEDVIDLVGPHYKKDPRVEIVHASAFDYTPPKGIRYDAVWHDIWDNICSDNLPDMKRLHRKYGRRCKWQGSWEREQCEYGY